MANIHPFQQWMEDNGVVDLRFYPGDTSSASATDLLDSAMEAIRAHEQGESVPYEDNVNDEAVYL